MSIYLTNVNVVACAAKGSELPDLIEDATVEIDDAKIVSVSTTPPPENVHVHDLAGRYLMPGLWDAHVHLGSRVPPYESLLEREEAAEQMARCITKAQDNLRHGVTSIRSLGEPHDMDLKLRDLIRKGMVWGPNLYGVGNVKWSQKAAGVDEFRRHVRTTALKDADEIKLLITGGIPYNGPIDALTSRRPEVRAAIEEAHMWGRSVAVHAMGNEPTKMAIEEGADVIEHGFGCTPEIAELFLRKGLVFSPQLTVTDRWTRAYAEAEGLPQWFADNAEASREGHHELFAKVVELGGTVVAGVDNLPRRGVDDIGIEWADDVPGLVREIELMVQLGLDVAEGLRAATRNVAAVLGMDEQTGSIEEGKAADMIILQRNPLDDIRALADVDAVWLAGRCVHRTTAPKTDKIHISAG
ncbi:amidohydrolase family protein [Nesterenkonia ebinurensis]|uniref:amidohydrolase family protein n=1 Tax=Nesterenkonia ebinurensis TaxID=2608252 RepID=UPI00123D9C1E|nr:amidohydrolase family protein [Nesterenkonia ebinurensis]